ncbi:DUF4136 domain-containing protein [Thiomicrorhabdus cannonii]|uniref:DUF4136 domain-containing protein n=1 Tax=Thiomicrorhabdus cannonii TaxID=2748011 RepID=UPI0015B9F225|nr:DUF4136 domain-containing protein [Thiomicrorhabdus cannonii]
MKHLIRTFWLMLTLFALGGCSGISVYQDYDPQVNLKAIKTLQWLPESMQVSPKAAVFAQQHPLLAQRIEQATARSLNAQGLRLQSDNANAYITYHIEVKTVLRPDPLTPTFGFGAFSRHSGIMWQTPPQYYEEEEGRLIIDILDINGRVLWRGSSPALITEQATPQQTTDYIQAVVSKILAQFPPAPPSSQPKESQ